MSNKPDTISFDHLRIDPQDKEVPKKFQNNPSAQVAFDLLKVAIDTQENKYKKKGPFNQAKIKAAKSKQDLEAYFIATLSDYFADQKTKENDFKSEALSNISDIQLDAEIFNEAIEYITSEIKHRLNLREKIAHQFSANNQNDKFKRNLIGLAADCYQDAKNDPDFTILSQGKNFWKNTYKSFMTPYINATLDENDIGKTPKIKNALMDIIGRLGKEDQKMSKEKPKEKHLNNDTEGYSNYVNKHLDKIRQNPKVASVVAIDTNHIESKYGQSGMEQINEYNKNRVTDQNKIYQVTVITKNGNIFNKIGTIKNACYLSKKELSSKASSRVDSLKSKYKIKFKSVYGDILSSQKVNNSNSNIMPTVTEKNVIKMLKDTLNWYNQSQSEKIFTSADIMIDRGEDQNAIYYVRLITKDGQEPIAAPTSLFSRALERFINKRKKIDSGEIIIEKTEGNDRFKGIKFEKYAKYANIRFDQGLYKINEKLAETIDNRIESISKVTGIDKQHIKVSIYATRRRNRPSAFVVISDGFNFYQGEEIINKKQERGSYIAALKEAQENLLRDDIRGRSTLTADYMNQKVNATRVGKMGLLFSEGLSSEEIDIQYDNSSITLEPETKKIIGRWIRLAKQNGIFANSVKITTITGNRRKKSIQVSISDGLDYTYEDWEILNGNIQQDVFITAVRRAIFTLQQKQERDPNYGFLRDTQTTNIKKIIEKDLGEMYKNVLQQVRVATKKSDSGEMVYNLLMDLSLENKQGKRVDCIQSVSLSSMKSSANIEEEIAQIGINTIRENNN